MKRPQQIKSPPMTQINDKAPDLKNRLRAGGLKIVATPTHNKNDFKTPFFRNIFKNRSLIEMPNNGTFRFKNEETPTRPQNDFKISTVRGFNMLTILKGLPLGQSFRKTQICHQDTCSGASDSNGDIRRQDTRTDTSVSNRKIPVPPLLMTHAF